MRPLAFALTLTVTIVASAASARTPAFDPQSYKSQVAGPPTQVLVLGTPHLSGAPATFKTEYLAPLIDRLATFNPNIVTIEALSGAQCDILLRYKADYAGVADDYCGSTEVAQTSTGLGVPAAAHEVRNTLAAWPADKTPSQRRRLAALFAASGDRASAMVQWLRLPDAERRVGDSVDGPLVELLTKTLTHTNENFQIAAVLAARLGLERVHPVDDHTADGIIANSGKEFEAAIQRIWAKAPPAALDLRAKSMLLGSARDTLATYRLVNAPASQRMSIDVDFGAALRDITPEYFGRQYVAWWEVRNLRMVANIRTAFGNTPGARVLVIVGAGHKGYFDAYLNQMHEVRLIDAGDVLK